MTYLKLFVFVVFVNILYRSAAEMKHSNPQKGKTKWAGSGVVWLLGAGWSLVSEA